MSASDRVRVRRRWPFVVLGAFGVGCFGVGAVGAQEGGDATGGGGELVLGLTAAGQSDGVGATFGDPGAQPYPVAAGQMGHTTATMGNGPAGYALASTTWPGPLVANAGSLAVLLGAPAEAGQANYAGRAEAFSAGPTEADLGPMHAAVDGYVSEARNRVEDAEGSPGIAFGDVSTVSRSAFEDGVVQASSSCTASDIVVGDAGVLRIGSVRTESASTTNGTESTAGGRTIVSGMTIGGTPAEVDEEGVRFTDQVTGPIQEQMLSQMGISMFVAQPQVSEEASRAGYRAGPLIIIWELPESGGYTWVYEICGSDTSVSLRTGEAFTPPTLATPAPAPPPSPGGGGAALPPSLPAPATAPGPAAAPPVSDGGAVLAPEPAGFVRDLSIWPYVVGALCCLAAAEGLRRGRDGLLAPRAAATSCPLEGARP